MDKARIYIVEDNRIVAEDIKQTLTSLDYEVAGIATSGEKALAMVESDSADMALMDINLGRGMDGIELAGIFREKYQIPVVYLTAHTDQAALDRAKKTQPFGYLIKPFDRQELQSTLEMALYKCRMDKKFEESAKAIQESEEKYRSFVENFQGIAFRSYEKDSVDFITGNITAITGYEKEDFDPGGISYYDLIHPDDQDWVKQEFTDFRTQNAQTARREYRIIDKSGQIHWVVENVSRLKPANGRVGVDGTIQDISYRKETETQIHLLKKAIDHLAESIIITDADTRIQYINKAFEVTTGYSKAEVLGRTPKIFQSGQHSEEFYREIRKTLARRETWFGIFINQKKDGSLFHEKATISPVLDKNSNITNYIAVKRDITDDLIKEKQIQQSQKMESIGTLAGGIAHDFNNILSPIIGFTQLSIMGVEKDSTLADNLDEIEKAAMRAKELVAQILTFARHSNENVAPIKIYPIVNEALKFIRSSIPSTIDIKTRIDRTGYVMADPTKIHQIVMNLCTNAFHSIKKDIGKISITLEEISLDGKSAPALGKLPWGTYIILRVSDTGTGILEKDMHTIFEPYFTTKKTGEGTGLGLAVCQGAARSMKGDILVDSEWGKGSTFTLYLPASKHQAHIKMPKKTDLPTGDKHILFVDDEVSVTKVNKRLLESLGYTVTIENSSVKALELFSLDPDRYDLVITDMTMPDMTGEQLARQIKKIRPRIPIILCSGFSKKITEHTVSDIGIGAYIKKPVSTPEMAQTLRHLLDQAGL